MCPTRPRLNVTQSIKVTFTCTRGVVGLVKQAISDIKSTKDRYFHYFYVQLIFRKKQFYYKFQDTFIRAFNEEYKI